MEKTKNIFDYATKELSQDAFLRWLFENYNCDDNASLKEASQKILREFCGVEPNEKISDVKTVAQWNKIDIMCIVETNNRKIALFIEDKTFSNIGEDQLVRYNEKIQNSSYFRKEDITDIKKVFFKTSALSKEDDNELENSGWNAYGINKIYELFKEYSRTDSIILSQFIERLERCYKAHQQTSIPYKNDDSFTTVKWKSYFDNTLIKLIENQIDNSKFQCHTKFIRYDYATIYINLKNIADGDVPYIELSSRSFNLEKKEVSVGLYCYLNDYQKRKPDIDKLKQNLEKLTDTIFSKANERTIEPKKIASTEKIKYENDDDIVKLLRDCIKDYEIIMKDWL